MDWPTRCATSGEVAGPDEGPAGDEVRTVAVNLARSRYRRRAVFDRLVRTGRVGRPEASVPGLSPDRVALVAALQRLPHAVREAVVLHHLADLPVAEIAAALGCSPSTVKARLVRGRRALSELLDEDEPVVPATDAEPEPPRVLAVAAEAPREPHHA